MTPYRTIPSNEEPIIFRENLQMMRQQQHPSS